MDLFLNHTTAKLGCPRHKRCTDGGRTFAVRAIQQWNNLNVDLKVTVVYIAIIYHSPDS